MSEEDRPKTSKTQSEEGHEQQDVGSPLGNGPDKEIDRAGKQFIKCWSVWTIQRGTEMPFFVRKLMGGVGIFVLLFGVIVFYIK